MFLPVTTCTHSSRQNIFFHQKILIFFLFLHENIGCGYSLEAPWQGASHEYAQHMFPWRNKKNTFIWSYDISFVCDFLTKLKEKFSGYIATPVRHHTQILASQHRVCSIDNQSEEIETYHITHLHQMDSSTTTLWTVLFPIAGCLVSFYYYYII